MESGLYFCTWDATRKCMTLLSVQTGVILSETPQCLLRASLLILHGTNDDRLDVYHAIRMGELLPAAGKERKLVLYPGGDHASNNYREAQNCELFQMV